MPRRFYGQVTYSDKNQAYIFVENDAIVSYRKWHVCNLLGSTIRSFQYDKKMKQFQQISIYKCELNMRHLLCQDVIFHRITGSTCWEIQRQPLSYVDKQVEQKKSVTMKKFQERDNLVPNRQDNDLWLKMPYPGTKIILRQNFNEYGLVQDEYLKVLAEIENIEQTSRQDRLGNKGNGQMSQLYRETKTDKMQKLRWEIEFPERGMQKVRMRLNRIQQAPLLTPRTSS